jgi:uncharacterized protein (DUF885 family)
MRHLEWAVVVAFVLAGCTDSTPGAAPVASATAPITSAVSAPPPGDGGTMKSSDTGAGAQLEAFSADFLGEYLKRNPTRATEAGEHRFDGAWPDVSEAGEARERQFVEDRLKALASIPAADLSPQQRIDRGLIENQLHYWLFSLTELRDPAWDPLVYTRLVGDGLDPLVTRDFGTLEERMKSLRSRLAGVPNILAVAKKRLQKSPKIYTETAIAQNKGLIALCQHDLAEHFAKVPDQKVALETAAKLAADALVDFQKFLETDLLPRSDGDFRLGRARFEKKLRFDLDDPVDIDAVAQGARDLLQKTQDDMAETAKELWPELMKPAPLPSMVSADERKAVVRKVLDKIGGDHPDNATIVKEATEWLDKATKFVREHDLVTVPDEPCKVIEMPEYRRGVAIAYCDSSGPLEAKQETFYSIAPTPKEWPKKRVDSFFREYNRSMLADLTIHEAMPGHFLQLMHNNRFSSKIRAVFSSGAFVEGWAVYGEWLMAKYGFGGAKVRMMRQKMVLRLSANAILDHDIHAGTMDEKAALDLMTKEAFQEEGEAVGKWKRARLSSAQLTTYYYGFTEMMKLRAAHEKAPGFTEKAYHDKLIGSGSPSMRAARELMGK